MSNSGVPQFPQPGQYRPDTSQQGPRAGDNDFSFGQLDKAPREIRAEITAARQAIRLEGEVARSNADGSVRVTTQRGDVDVRLPADQPRPQAGQRVEVEITPPPRSDATAPAQVAIRDASPAAEARIDAARAEAARQSATPVQIEVSDGRPTDAARNDAQIVRPSDTNANATPAPNRFPETGSLARLDPVSPQQLEALVNDRQLASVETVQSALSRLPASITDPLPPQVGSAAAITNASSAQTVSPNAILNTQAQSSTSGAATQTVLGSSTSISTLSTGITNADGSISAPVNPLANTPFAKLPTALQTSNAQALPFNAQDVRVGNIQAPAVSISAPTSANNAAQVIATPDNIAQNPILSGQKAGQVSGVVIAKTLNQVPLVNFNVPTGNTGIAAQLNPVAQQTFILQFPSDALLLGSQVDVSSQSLNAQLTSTNQASTSTLQASASALPALPLSNIALPQSWPLLQDIQQSLSQSTAQAAAQSAQAFSAVIPSPANTAQFGPAALFFVAALRGGDLGSWLSDKAGDILKSEGKSSLLNRLASEGNTLNSAARETLAQDWRGMNIPLMWDGDIQKIALHYKHDQTSDDDDKSSGNKGTRFVFDLDLDTMGKVQLDGFFRPISENGPRLDIVLRTEERFSASVQAEMRRMYMDAIKPSQVSGELSFQDGVDAWVMIDAQGNNALGVNA